MKKIYLLLLTGFLNLAFFSCNPTSLVEEELMEQATDCCDEEGDIPPTPTDVQSIDCCDEEGDIPPSQNNNNNDGD